MNTSLKIQKNRLKKLARLAIYIYIVLFSYNSYAQDHFNGYDVVWLPDYDEHTPFAIGGTWVKVEWPLILNDKDDYYEITVTFPGGSRSKKLGPALDYFHYYVPCMESDGIGQTVLTAYEHKENGWYPDTYEITNSFTTVSYSSPNPIVKSIGMASCNAPDPEYESICFPAEIDVSGIDQPLNEFRTFKWTSVTKNQIVESNNICHTPQDDEFEVYGSFRAAVYSVEVDYPNNSNDGDKCLDKPQIVPVVFVDMNYLTDFNFGQGCVVQNDKLLPEAVRCAAAPFACELPESPIDVVAQAGLTVKQYWSHKTPSGTDQNNMSPSLINEYKVCYNDVFPKTFEDYIYQTEFTGTIAFKDDPRFAKVDIDVNCTIDVPYRVTTSDLILGCNRTNIRPNQSWVMKGDENPPPGDWFYLWVPSDNLSNPNTATTTFTAPSNFCGAVEYTLIRSDKPILAGVGIVGIMEPVYCEIFLGPLCVNEDKGEGGNTTPTQSSEFLNQELEVNIYPNPVNDKLNISVSKLKSDGVIRIFNFNGQLLHSQKVLVDDKSSHANLEIDIISTLPNGQYLLQLFNENQTITKKFMVIHN
jgi:hypothetical protein